VPSVRHRDGGQAITNALPITLLIGTVLDIGSQWSSLVLIVAFGPQW
jgi:hypothetical protein